MPRSTSSLPRGRDLRTKAIVLRRTKYGETDRILSLLTPEGKLDVVAKGVRKEKSKLAGGVELFSISEVTVHQSPDEERLGILTSAKMLQFYNQILSNLARLELASSTLKQVSRVASDVKDPQLFSLLEQVLAGLHRGLALDLVETWFLLNLTKLSGEDINLHFDTTGAKLAPDQNYAWDNLENALTPHAQGRIGTDHIKLLRLMLSAPLTTVAQVSSLDQLLPEILPLARAVAQR